jgi:8-oxo-dGTP diphosphatase
MIAQRRPADHYAGLWEFPGGKVELGETPEEALRRELQEECDVDIEVGDLVAEVLHDHPGGAIRLLAFACTVRAGEPRPVLCAALRWVKPEELRSYPMSPADLVVVDRLRPVAPEP